MTNIPKKEPSETNERASVDSTAGLVKRKTVENKAQKEAIVKAELQDAINSIRRPNRDVVGKDMAETTERRATTSLSQLRSKFDIAITTVLFQILKTLQNPRSQRNTRDYRAA